MRALRPGAEILIGNDCGISGGSICAAMRVELGNECLLGDNVTIADTDFHTIKPTGRRFNNNPQEIGAAPVKIEDNVFIGTGGVVLKGVCWQECCDWCRHSSGQGCAPRCGRGRKPSEILKEL